MTPTRHIQVEQTPDGWQVRLVGKCCTVTAPTRDEAIARFVVVAAPLLGLVIRDGPPEPTAA